MCGGIPSFIGMYEEMRERRRPAKGAIDAAGREAGGALQLHGGRH